MLQLALVQTFESIHLNEFTDSSSIRSMNTAGGLKKKSKKKATTANVKPCSMMAIFYEASAPLFFAPKIQNSSNDKQMSMSGKTSMLPWLHISINLKQCWV